MPPHWSIEASLGYEAGEAIDVWRPVQRKSCQAAGHRDRVVACIFIGVSLGSIDTRISRIVPPVDVYVVSTKLMVMFWPADTVHVVANASAGMVSDSGISILMIWTPSSLNAATAAYGVAARLERGDAVCLPKLQAVGAGSVACDAADGGDAGGGGDIQYLDAVTPI